jgi:hypothetical protein
MKKGLRSKLIQRMKKCEVLLLNTEFVVPATFLLGAFLSSIREPYRFLYADLHVTSTCLPVDIIFPSVMSFSSSQRFPGFLSELHFVG